MTQPETKAQVRDRLAEKYAKEIRNDAVIGPLPLEKIMAVKFGWDARDKLAQQEVEELKAERNDYLEYIRNLKCECKYKPFTHQYFFECKRCEFLSKHKKEGEA